MFAVAIFVGIYSYLVFALGVLGVLYKNLIILITFLFIMLSYFYFKGKPQDLPKINFRNEKIRPFLFIFVVLAIVNLIGAIGPELAFDALWYHLTLPKIFLENHGIDFIPGELFYYSVMPKLGEMLYIVGLSFSSEVIPKLIQFSFGVLSAFVIYRISRKFLDEKFSILASLIFYSSLVVAWQSTVAYIDLIRTFFEAMTFWGFLNWHQTKERKWLIESGVMLGLALSTKLLASGSLIIFLSLILLTLKKEKKGRIITDILVYLLTTIFIAAPWLVFSFLATGNPVYPIFSEFYNAGLKINLLSPLNFVRDLFLIFLKGDDPISPVFAIVSPLLFVVFKKLDRQTKIVAIYSLFALILWYLTPRTGGGRFILPYLPAFSVFCMIIISKLKDDFIKKYLVVVIIIVSFVTIIYRGVANAKYLPVILGLQTKNDFLSKNLNFEFGDFYDTNGWFLENVKKDDRILLYGFHNLYYVNFPFIHESYVKAGDRFSYVALQNSELPKRFSEWELIYENNKTNVKVYSNGGLMWSY